MEYLDNSPSFIPNINRNVKIEEIETGIRLNYTLSCPKDFPNKTGITKKNKAYYRTSVDIKYQNHMSNEIYTAYVRLKNKTMLELAKFKELKAIEKVHNLTAQQLELF